MQLKVVEIWEILGYNSFVTNIVTLRIEEIGI